MDKIYYINYYNYYPKDCIYSTNSSKVNSFPFLVEDAKISLISRSKSPLSNSLQIFLNDSKLIYLSVFASDNWIIISFSFSSFLIVYVYSTPSILIVLDPVVGDANYFQILTFFELKLVKNIIKILILLNIFIAL